MKSAICAGWIALAAALPALAQDASLVGKYAFGNFQHSGSNDNRVILNITNVENGTVKGTMERITSGKHGTKCGGEVPVEGTLKGTTLRVRSTEKAGRGGDCNTHFTGEVNGSTLVGKFGQNNVTLTK